MFQENFLHAVLFVSENLNYSASTIVQCYALKRRYEVLVVFFYCKIIKFYTIDAKALKIQAVLILIGILITIFNFNL